MNEDFSEIFSKFSDILKEKNIDLNDIAGGTQPPANESEPSIDIETILKIKDIITKINRNQDCPRNKLLIALKPYLENNKQEKLDNYIKIANLLSIMENLDTGFNFLKNKEGYDFVLIITLFLLII